MCIAVVGAGLAGLSASYYLGKKGYNVSVFSSGEGASHVASGLLHPYVGKKAKRSLYADQAMSETKKLLLASAKALGRPVCLDNGILRMGMQEFTGPDIKKVNEGHLILSGITVFMKEYLEGLKLASKATYINQEIQDLDELREFDRIVLATGSRIKQFDQSNSLGLQFLKGQVFTCKMSNPPVRSYAGNGQLALNAKKNEVQFGATYERHFSSITPNYREAMDYLGDRLEMLYPKWRDLEILKLSSGIRVMQKTSYLPIVRRESDRCFLFVGLGSRGLLYHGYYGLVLANLVDSSF